MFTKRPKSTETDEDLLKQQEKFLQKLAANQLVPSVKVVPIGKNVEKPESDTLEKDEIQLDIEEQLANTFEAIPSVMNIGNVVEKRKIEDVEFNYPVFSKNTGFPVAKRRETSDSGSNEIGRSIFSQQLKQNKTVMKTTVPLGKIVKESKLLSESQKNEIHNSNMNILKSTPDSEILEEKERLLNSMDPAIIAFLRAKRRDHERVQASESSNSIEQQNEHGTNLNIGKIDAAVELLEAPGSENWVHFNAVETHKLAWMKRIDGGCTKIDKNKAFEARFDFEGWLMPLEYIEINEKNRILYHHGEEPGRPGYTLQELFTLARSSVTQQKIIALNSIANILSLYSLGVYQDVLELPLEQLFFLIRFCLDDNTTGVLTASLKALRSLIYSNVDEICLELLLGLENGHIVPLLCVDNQPDDDRVNDQQLAEKNVMKCLVRTGIFTRIRYILNTLKPPLETIVYCLEICTRLAEDSDVILDVMFKCENLILSIFKHFIPSSSNYCHESANIQSEAFGKPVVQAVKLARILSCRSADIAKTFVEKYKIVDSLSLYLQDETFGSNANGMKLQTESFHLWRVLMEYNLTGEYSSILENILLKHLLSHFKNTEISERTTYVREGHLASILTVLGKFIEVKPSILPSFRGVLRDCIGKWCTQQCEKTVCFQCRKSRIISSLLFMCGKIVKLHSELNEFVEENVMKLMRSVGFEESTKNIRKCSMLLNNYEPQANSANLKNLKTAAWYTPDHVVPIVQSTSCFLFLNALSHFITKSNNNFLKLSFLKGFMMREYLDSLEQRKSHFLTDHWLTRLESELLMNVLKISVDVQKDLDSTFCFYALAVKLLCVFNEEQRKNVQFLLDEIIFNSSFYPSENLLENLRLEEHNVEFSLKCLDEIRQVYSEILGLKLNHTGENFCLEISKGNIIPVDWTYTPIILLYTNQQQEKKTELSETQRIFIIKNCLRWLVVYETYFPTLIATLDPTDRFCRLACVFLADDCIFLNEQIHNLLAICLRNILEKHELNFNKPIEGLKNFQDFYNQMLEQYQGVSYGDQLFGNFILVPLTQTQNVQWRKSLWSEYMGVVQILNVPKEKLMTKLEKYLHPLEQDESLLNCYKVALTRNLIRKTSVLYTIASHHIKGENQESR